jgi:hypothetical protein
LNAILMMNRGRPSDRFEGIGAPTLVTARKIVAFGMIELARCRPPSALKRVMATHMPAARGQIAKLHELHGMAFGCAKFAEANPPTGRPP